MIWKNARLQNPCWTDSVKLDEDQERGERLKALSTTADYPAYFEVQTPGFERHMNLSMRDNVFITLPSVILLE